MIMTYVNPIAQVVSKHKKTSKHESYAYFLENILQMLPDLIEYRRDAVDLLLW